MEYKIFESSDTNVKKFVFEWGASAVTRKGIAEAVLYRYGEYAKRTVICCSVQSGCPVGCTFCGTGKFFVRNLDWHEIVEQVTTVLSTIDCDTKDIEKFQIMFMSMGEPFLNYINLERAIESLHDLYPNAQLLVSTSAPSTLYHAMSEFIELSKRIPQVGLQFSVHESTDEARAKLIPTKTCTLRQIAAAGEFWAANTGRKPFFNYCVHAGNQTWEDEPVEIPPMSTFIKDLYSRKDENGNQFKYFIFKIEDLADAMGENIEVFFEIADMYNQYRANHKGKAPSKYWIINRDEVPEIKSFEEFKKKVTE